MIASSKANSTTPATLARPWQCLGRRPFAVAAAASVALASLALHAGDDREGHRLRFLRMVVGRDRITVEGRETPLDRLDARLAKVPEPQHAVLEVAASNKAIEPTRYRIAAAAVQQACQRLGFREVRQIDPCPLGSRACKVGFVGPLVYGKEIQLGLLTGPDEYPEMVRARHIRFRRKWLKVKADLRIGWTARAEARWRIVLELLDADRQVLAVSQQTVCTRVMIRRFAMSMRRPLGFDLGSWANVQGAREFMVTLARVTDEGFEVCAKEYPKDQAPALKGLEWGAADDGTSCRLRLAQRAWQERETPVVLADVRYRGHDRDFSLRRGPADFELELNGVWHAWQGKPGERRWLLKRGQNYHEGISVPLDSHWQSKGDGRPIQIADGRHTLRLAFVPEPLDDASRPVRAVSQPMAIFCGPHGVKTYQTLQEEGQEILRAMVRACNCWLVGPPEAVKTYAYEFVYWDKERVKVKVSTSSKTPPSSRQGITFRTPLHALARDPSRAVITEIERDAACTMLRYDLTRAARVEIGTGIRPRGRWTGYWTYSTSRGRLWVDSSKHVPIRAEDRPGREVCFLDYAAVGNGRYAPQRIRATGTKSRNDWRFATYWPGLWLFDRGGPRYAVVGLFIRTRDVSVCKVTINGQPARRLR